MYDRSTAKPAERLELAIGGLVVLAALLACGRANKTEATESSPTPSIADSAAVPPTIKSLLSAYKSDQAAADRQFKGKTISITGTVVSVNKDSGLNVTVANTKDYELPSLQCNPAAGQETKAGALTKGETVTVQGTIDGAMMNVTMKDCQIVSSSPAP